MATSFGNILGDIALGVGRNNIIGPELEEQQANADLKKQQVQMNQMAMMSQQQQMATQKTIGAYISTQLKADASIATNPAQMAQLYSKAAGLAAQKGDFASAEEMSRLATDKLNESKSASAVLAQQQQQKKELLADAADDYSANPSADTATDLVRKAVDAGVNPTTIPAPGSTQFKTWATQQQLASKTAAEKADFLQKVYETNANRELRQQEHQDTLEERDLSRRQTAAFQQGVLSLRQAEEADKANRAPTTKDVAGSTYEWDPSGQLKGDRNLPDRGWVKVGGPKQTATQEGQNNAIVASASEALRGLRIVGAMDNSVTAGPFAGLHDGTILDSIAKTGSNALTPADMQIYHTATAGMGLEIARTMTLGAGRGANQATINEMQNIVEAHSGDDQATVVFKYANAADIIRNRLSTLPDSPDPIVKKQRSELETQLAKIPAPEAVLAAVKDPKQKAKLLGIQDTMSATAERMETEAQSASGSPATDTNAPKLQPNGALPSGWSVTEH